MRKVMLNYLTCTHEKRHSNKRFLLRYTQNSDYTCVIQF